MLTDCESSRKTPEGEYPDLCDTCLEPIKEDLELVENPLCDDTDETQDSLFDKSTKGDGSNGNQ